MVSRFVSRLRYIAAPLNVDNILFGVIWVEVRWKNQTYIIFKLLSPKTAIDIHIMISYIVGFQRLNFEPLTCKHLNG
jgi:hypothetical protein